MRSYASDQCAQDVTLGFDVVRVDTLHRLHRLGTYASRRIAHDTAEQVHAADRKSPPKTRYVGIETRVIDRTALYTPS